MAIDLTKETLVPFGKLARLLPRRRQDRPVAPSTIHRWRKNGLRGVQLEAVKVGGAWFTTHEAFHRFVTQLTIASDSSPPIANSTLARPKKPNPQRVDDDRW